MMNLHSDLVQFTVKFRWSTLAFWICFWICFGILTLQNKRWLELKRLRLIQLATSVKRRICSKMLNNKATRG